MRIRTLGALGVAKQGESRMTNTLCEADIVRQQEIVLQRKERRLSEHKKRHKEKQGLVQAI